jgi:hypothetical protein
VHRHEAVLAARALHRVWEACQRRRP